MPTEEQLLKAYTKASAAYQSKPGPKTWAAFVKAQDTYAAARTERKSQEASDPDHPRQWAAATISESE